MRHTFDGFKLVLLYASGVILGLTIWSGVSAVPSAVPNLYTQLRPVVQFGYTDKITKRGEAPVQNIYRDGDKVCWSLFSEKLNPAKVVGYQFWATGGEASARIPTASYLAHEDNTPDRNRILESHDVGEQWHRRWCFDLADRFPDFHSITIEGQAEHMRWPRLWKTLTSTPTFTVAPTSR